MLNPPKENRANPSKGWVLEALPPEGVRLEQEQKAFFMADTGYLKGQGKGSTSVVKRAFPIGPHRSH